MECLSKKKAFI